MLRFVQHHTNVTCDHCGTASKRSLCIPTTNPGSLRVVGNLRAGARTRLANIQKCSGRNSRIISAVDEDMRVAV
jgi:hypothetical protein